MSQLLDAIKSALGREGMSLSLATLSSCSRKGSFPAVLIHTVVADHPGVVADGEVRVLVRLGLRLHEDGQLAQGGAQLLLETLVSRLGEQGLLLQDGPEAQLSNNI